MVKMLMSSWAEYRVPFAALTFRANDKPDGKLEITLDNGYKTTIPNDHLFTPKRGSDENGQYVVTNSSVIETGIAYNVDDNEAGTIPILGGLFLTFNYLAVDSDNNQFQMAPAVQGAQESNANIVPVYRQTSTALNPESSSNQTDRPHADKSPRSAAIGGGTAGAIAGLATIICLYYFAVHKRGRDRRQRDQAQAEQATTTEKSENQMPRELALTTVPTLHELPDRHYEKKLPSLPIATLNAS
ncbi:MAG: hypothetical protein LQ343_007761 [Gyalolechia ehrenbergii]|nr:MAG: hypothetical protein LQ343_007761 [Gyalolechia ehrenbergii]